MNPYESNIPDANLYSSDWQKLPQSSPLASFAFALLPHRSTTLWQTPSVYTWTILELCLNYTGLCASRVQATWFQHLGTGFERNHVGRRGPRGPRGPRIFVPRDPFTCDLHSSKHSHDPRSVMSSLCHPQRVVAVALVARALHVQLFAQKGQVLE